MAHYLMQTGVQGRNVVAEAAAAVAPTTAAAASAPQPAEVPVPAEPPTQAEASPGQAPADSAPEPEAPTSLPAPAPAAAPRPARTKASAQVNTWHTPPALASAAALPDACPASNGEVLCWSLAPGQIACAYGQALHYPKLCQHKALLRSQMTLQVLPQSVMTCTASAPL